MFKLFALFAGVIVASFGGADTLKTYQCPKVTTAPTIDGRLDDDAWAHAPAVVLVQTHDGAPVDKLTLAKMCWDSDNLYVSFRCSSKDIRASVTNHDGNIFLEDAVEIFIDPDGDLKTYIELDVSPINVTFDAKFDPAAGASLGAQLAPQWTCQGFRTATTVDGTVNVRTDTDQCWTAEMAIPFKSISAGTPAVNDTWRANLYRAVIRPRPTELQAWSPTYASSQAFHVTKRFGKIVFVEKNRQGTLAKTKPRS